MNKNRFRVIACMTVGEELEGLIPEGTEMVLLEFGLHDYPGKLKYKLQEEIHRTRDVDAILLGYGLCGMGTLGLSSSHSRLVIPRMHDCIGIFLGHREKHQEQVRNEPGTYYLTKGWINHGGDPYKEFLKWQEKYGTNTAHILLNKTIGNYTRLAFIQTGKGEHKQDIAYARKVAKNLGLRFEKIMGNRNLLRRMIIGDWDKDFIVLEPGERVTLAHFF